MCRIPKVVVIAPPDEHLQLRRTLSSLEYDIVATLAPGAELDVTADVALVCDPTDEDVRRLRERGVKVVGFGAPNASADLAIDDVAAFKTRIWDVLRPRGETGA